MSEIAMVSAKKSRLETAARKGDSGAKKALELAQNPSKFFSTVQIGITVIGILTGIYSGERIQDDLVGYLNQFASLQSYSDTIALFVIVSCLTFFTLVLGELVPKRIGITMPEKISKLFAYPMFWISKIAAPFIWLLTVSTEFLVKLFRIKPSDDSQITEEEIKALIQEGTEGGVIEEIEQDIVERVFSLGDRKISSLMTHLSDTVSLHIEDDVNAIRTIVNEEMHSVYPVLDSKRELVGMVLLKDLFRYINEPDFKLSTHLRPPQYVSETLNAYEVLSLFKTNKLHQGIVVDEFGQMQGIVTMNDLLEALVGDVSEFDDSEYLFVERDDGSWLVDGQYPMADFLYRFELEDLIPEYNFNTISGLILLQTRNVPATGAVIHWLDFKLEVVDMDGARIDKVLVTRKTDKPEDE